MKKSVQIIAIALVTLFADSAVGQNDTIYVIQDGVVLWKHATSSLDSIIFYDLSAIEITTNSSITDADGNVYTSVTIGTQKWMVENLRTTKYSDGTIIPNVTVDDEWEALSTAAWCNYNNTSTNDATYGKLYNWYAVETGKLCPTGWHVPTDTEWTVLTDYLAVNGHNGTALKATSGWNIGGNGTDDYGWNGLPSGERRTDGSFSGIDGSCTWWSRSKDDLGYLSGIDLSYKSNGLGGYLANSKSVISVRCLRD